MPFLSPPAITLTDTPSGWLENAIEHIISLQCTCPIRSPFTVHSLKSLPPPTVNCKKNFKKRYFRFYPLPKEQTLTDAANNIISFKL